MRLLTSLPILFFIWITASAFTGKGDWVVLRAGTKVPLVLQTALDPKEVGEGYAVALSVDGHIMVNQKVLVAHGAAAAGMVVEKQYLKKEKAFQLTVTAEWAQTVDGQRASLTSVFYIFKIPCCDGTTSLNHTFDGEVMNDIKIKT